MDTYVETYLNNVLCLITGEIALGISLEKKQNENYMGE